MNYREFSFFEDKINITLLNDLIRFVCDTVKLSGGHLQALRRRCMLMTFDTTANAFQEKYGFLYLGELLERYEERHGMTLPDLRAIALALGYTKELVTEDMFVGDQYSSFVQQVQNQAENDIYLQGALALMHGESTSEYYERLEAHPYTKVGELLFVLSLYDDFAKGFPIYKAQLVQLLTTDRTLSIVGNSKPYNWLVTRLQSVLKNNRSKDLALLRSLCMLPTAFVKPGSKHYVLLLKHGYSSLEIAYGNAMLVQYQTAAGVLSRNSLVTEKIIVELFRTALSEAAALPADAYEHLPTLFMKYKSFKIKCYGYNFLSEALGEELVIINPTTFAWFSKFMPHTHPVFSAFDIMDPHWDHLAVDLEPGDYLNFFEQLIHEKMTSCEIRDRIQRFNELTGSDYLQSYWESSSGSLFDILVEKDILDLWDAFTRSIDKEGNVIKPRMVKRIGSYLYELRTLHAFHFCEQFLPAYGFAGANKYFERWAITSGLIDRRGYGSNYSFTLLLNQSYLDDEKRLTILGWLEEYYFENDPKHYLEFAVAVLKSRFAAEIMPKQQIRELYDLLVQREELMQGHQSTLRGMYLSQEELDAEKWAAQQRQLALEREKLADMEESLRESYKSQNSHSMAEIVSFLDRCSYPTERRDISHRIVYEDLPTVLNSTGYQLSDADCPKLLTLCAKLLQSGTMTYDDAKKYICMTNRKEAA